MPVDSDWQRRFVASQGADGGNPVSPQFLCGADGAAPSDLTRVRSYPLTIVWSGQNGCDKRSPPI
jgi:hypothetical protein